MQVLKTAARIAAYVSYALTKSFALQREVSFKTAIFTSAMHTYKVSLSLN